jgi:transposase InsO family protein
MKLQGEDKHGNPDKKEVASLSNALRELCAASLQLALRFRSSKTKYEFRTYPDNTSLPACDEGIVKMLNSEGPISKPTDPSKLRIFCTLFGALVKTRPPVSGQASEPVVLEAGHVIVYEPQSRGPPQ